MPEDNRVFKGVLAGIAGGMVAGWAVNRFYELARRSARQESMLPYAIGAGIGAAYAVALHHVDMPLLARIPLGAAIYMGEPEKAAAAKGGRNLSERAEHMAMRAAAKGLKRVAEKALFA